MRIGQHGELSMVLLAANVILSRRQHVSHRVLPMLVGWHFCAAFAGLADARLLAISRGFFISGTALPCRRTRWFLPSSTKISFDSPRSRTVRVSGERCGWVLQRAGAFIRYSYVGLVARCAERTWRLVLDDNAGIWVHRAYKR